MKTNSVVTYQSPSGAQLNICTTCESKLDASGKWPKDSTGQEYCSYSHGLHTGNCDLCDRAQGGE